MERKLAELSCTGFTEMTASALPVPGGGGVSALAGALAASLGDMVGELTVGKKKYAEVEPEIRACMEKSQKIRCRLLELIDEDAENFQPLAKAYGLPKEEPGREQKLEECLKLAVKAPVEIFDLCCECIELLNVFSEKGSRLMISDAATGAALARGALEGAAVNIRVNTRLMKDRDTARGIEDHVAEKLSVYAGRAEQIFRFVYQGLERNI